VTRNKSDAFIADFNLAPERDHALCKASIEIGGPSLPLRPWYSVGGTTESVWWYHVEVMMENVPLEAWNEEGVKLILGDSCILDRLDSRTMSRESSEFHTWLGVDG
jgi:hypothetical protein